MLAGMAELKDRVAAKIEEMRPYLERSGGHVELVEVEDGIAKIRVALTRPGPSRLVASLQLKSGIERALRADIPGLRGVEAINLPPYPSSLDQLIRGRAGAATAGTRGWRLEQLRRSRAPLRKWVRIRVHSQHLHANVIGAVRDVLVDPRADRADVAPRDDRVHERVAAFAAQIRIAPADTSEVVRVVIEREVALHVPSRGRASHDGIA